MDVIEQFNSEYVNVFKIASARDRWIAIRDAFAKDSASARVLFGTEVLALIDSWKEPTPEQLLALHDHQRKGGRIAFRIGNMWNLFQPVWVVEVAKFDVITYRAISEKRYDRKYPLIGIKTYQSAVVQAWWALETMMNDLAGIIRRERKEIDAATAELLDEQRSRLNKDGTITTEPYYQYVTDRIQFAYRVLTGEGIDRDGEDWRNVMNLKNARDVFMHRLSKDRTDAEREVLWNPEIVFNGFRSVRAVLANVFRKTPEFRDRVAYAFLAFWSLDVEQPFVWDGSGGESLYLGLGSIDPDTVVRHFAPYPASFAQPGDDLLRQIENVVVPEKPVLD